MVSKRMADEEEEEGMLRGGREAMLSGLHVMDSRFTGATDEDEELIPGKRVFTGFKFEDEESQATARRVGYASLALAGLAVLHAILQAAWRHEVLNTTLHLVLGLLLPFVGYRGASLDHGARWRPRLLWAFHVGNVIFVIVHAVMLVTVVTKVMAWQGVITEQACGHDGACQESVDATKRHLQWLMVIWCGLSLPYWGCAAYAAYHCHELYLQLRIQDLRVRHSRVAGDLSDERLATVTWADEPDVMAE